MWLTPLLHGSLGNPCSPALHSSQVPSLSHHLLPGSWERHTYGGAPPRPPRTSVVSASGRASRPLRLSFSLAAEHRCGFYSRTWGLAEDPWSRVVLNQGHPGCAWSLWEQICLPLISSLDTRASNPGQQATACGVKSGLLPVSVQPGT